MINHLDRKMYLRKAAWWWNFPRTMIVTGLGSYSLAPQKRMCRDSKCIFELGFIQSANHLRRQQVNITRIAIYLISSENIHIKSRLWGGGSERAKWPIINFSLAPLVRWSARFLRFMTPVSLVSISCILPSFWGYLASSTGLNVDLLSVFQYQPCISKEDQGWESTLIQHMQTMNSLYMLIFILCSCEFLYTI